MSWFVSTWPASTSMNLPARMTVTGAGSGCCAGQAAARRTRQTIDEQILMSTMRLSGVCRRDNRVRERLNRTALGTQAWALDRHGARDELDTLDVMRPQLWRCSPRPPVRSPRRDGVSLSTRSWSRSTPRARRAAAPGGGGHARPPLRGDTRPDTQISLRRSPERRRLIAVLHGRDQGQSHPAARAHRCGGGQTRVAARPVQAGRGERLVLCARGERRQGDGRRVHRQPDPLPQEDFRPRRDIKLALTCGEETPSVQQRQMASTDPACSMPVRAERRSGR